MNVPPYATTDEDCLTLNVWVPPGGAARKPVMVWIPGGAFIEGSGGYQLYEGARLAAREDVVVVTINYRIGALGFLSHPALAREAGLATSLLLQGHRSWSRSSGNLRAPGASAPIWRCPPAAGCSRGR